MTLHVLVEGPSERVFLERWSKRFRPAVPVKVHPHSGKGKLPKVLSAPPGARQRGLLDQLPATLRGFARCLDPETSRVLILVDADDEPADALEATLVNVVRECAPALHVAVCVAVEELEAFYLADLDALGRGYPDADLQAARDYVPDSICGTWELFGRVVNDRGGNKVAWAEVMGPILTTNPRESRSPSFRKFVKAVVAPAATPTTNKSSRRYRHPPKDRGDIGKRR